MPFELNPSPYFSKKVKKLLNKNLALLDNITESLTNLSLNPKDPILSSHKVNSPKFGICFSSKITGDLRVLWKYNKDGKMEVIDLIDIGGHSGSTGVY